MKSEETQENKLVLDQKGTSDEIEIYLGPSSVVIFSRYKHICFPRNALGCFQFAKPKQYDEYKIVTMELEAGHSKFRIDFILRPEHEDDVFIRLTELKEHLCLNISSGIQLVFPEGSIQEM